MDQWQIGDISITRVIEMEGPSFKAWQLLPEAGPEALDPHRDWLEPRFLEPETNRLVLSFHAFVVKTTKHTILIDTCVGNDKQRSYKGWSGLQTRFLDNLVAAGTPPEDIDFVLCTHMHVDHIGWNTRLLNGRWVPTFPNAKYIFSRDEWDHWKAMDDDAHAAGGFIDGSHIDSILPVEEAGQCLVVDRDYAIDDEIWLEPTPGHTAGHTSIHMSSKGQDAVVTGDMIHHPVQIVEPEWSSFACYDKPMSRSTRRNFIDRYADTNTLILGTHFVAPTVGHIVSNKENDHSEWKIKFLGDD